MAYIAATLNPEILKKFPGPVRVGKKKSGSGRVAGTRQGLLVTNIMSANTVHLHSQLCSCIHLFCINILSHRWQILDCIVLNSDASQSSPVKYPDFLHQHYDVQLRPNPVHRGSQLCSGTKAASSFYASTLWWSTEVKYSASIQSRCIQLFCINIPTPCPMSRPRPHIGLETDAVWSTSSSWFESSWC